MWQRDTSLECPDDEDEDSDTISSTAYDIMGLEEDSRYSITVTALNDESSEGSNTVTAMTEEAGEKQDCYMLLKSYLYFQLHLLLLAM